MNFILCEGSNLSYLICQNSDTNECWTLIMHRYTFSFIDWTPPFIRLVGMKIQLLPEKKAIEKLEEYAKDTGVRGSEIREFLKRYKELPF